MLNNATDKDKSTIGALLALSLAVLCSGCDGQPKTVDGAAMVKVPAGHFFMGNEYGGKWGDESPQREVYLDEFWIDKYEVTRELYAQCVEAGGCTKPKKEGGPHSWGVSGREEHPINGVDWFQAKAYCTWAGKSLPTEAQWEKAARGTDARKYPWGNMNASCKYAVMAETYLTGGCEKSSIWRVGSKPLGVSPYGAHDMAGNVSEWTSDWFSREYYKIAPKKNPQGPSNGSARVVRGGSLETEPHGVRAANRSKQKPIRATFAFGFRCAKVK